MECFTEWNACIWYKTNILTVETKNPDELWTFKRCLLKNNRCLKIWICIRIFTKSTLFSNISKACISDEYQTFPTLNLRICKSWNFDLSSHVHRTWGGRVLNTFPKGRIRSWICTHYKLVSHTQFVKDEYMRCRKSTLESSRGISHEHTSHKNKKALTHFINICTCVEFRLVSWYYKFKRLFNILLIHITIYNISIS